LAQSKRLTMVSRKCHAVRMIDRQHDFPD